MNLCLRAVSTNHDNASITSSWEVSPLLPSGLANRGIQGDSEPGLVSVYPAVKGRKHQFWELDPCLHQSWLARPHCTQPGVIYSFILPFSKYLWNTPCCVPDPVLGCRALAANRVGIASGLVGAGFLWGGGVGQCTAGVCG